MRNKLRIAGICVVGLFIYGGRRVCGSPDLDYDVVAIHQAGPHVNLRGVDDRKNGIHAVDTLQGLVAYAYSQRAELVYDTSPKKQSTLYEVYAKVGDDKVTAFQRLSRTERARLLRKVLDERFGLSTRLENRNLPVYELSVAKGGPKLKKPNPNEGAHIFGSSGEAYNSAIVMVGGTLRAFGTSMDEFAARLPTYYPANIDRLVIDKTGLTERYDFTLTAVPPSACSLDENSLCSQDKSESTFTAIQEQLGLRLKPGRAVLPVIVIQNEHAPSPN